MPDTALTDLTASTPGTAGLLYAVQGGADRKLAMTAAGASMIEAANAAAQASLLGVTPITDPNVAYVRSDGNNSTGDGSPSSPLQTVQAAYNAGFRAFDLGVGSFGDLVVDDDNTLTFRGRGSGNSTVRSYVNSITVTPSVSDTFTLRIESSDVLFGTILAEGDDAVHGPNGAEAGDEGSDGDVAGAFAPALTLIGVKAVTVSLVAGAGGNGGNGFQSDDEYVEGSVGGNGGTGGNLNGTAVFERCEITNLYLLPGDGGNGGNGGDSGPLLPAGDGGNGADAGSHNIQTTFERSKVGTLFCVASGGGAGASGEDQGGGNGNDGVEGLPSGSAGAMDAKFSLVTTVDLGDLVPTKASSWWEGIFYTTDA